MPFEYRGDIAHSDVAFDAWGETIEEVFQEAAKATLKVMVEDISTIRQVEKIELQLDESSSEMLLFEFLNELIFYKDAKRLLLLPAELKISNSNLHLEGTLLGEEIDASRHPLDTDVKAVTMLRFALEQVPEGWRATVVLDV
jgi:SHS2 domain-containing protein